MAEEFFIPNTSGSDLRIFLFRAPGTGLQVWRPSTSAFIAALDANRTVCGFDARASGWTSVWVADAPAGLPEGAFYLHAYARVTPGIDAPGDYLQYQAEYYKNASGEVTLAGVPEAVREEMDASNTQLKRLLALTNDNAVLTSVVVDGDGNLTSAVKRVYDSAAHALADDGATGLLFTYAIAAVYDGNGNLTSYKETRT